VWGREEGRSGFGDDLGGLRGWVVEQTRMDQNMGDGIWTWWKDGSWLGLAGREGKQYGHSRTRHAMWPSLRTANSRTRRVMHYFCQQHYFQHAYRRFTRACGAASQPHETTCTAWSWLIYFLQRFAWVESGVWLESLCSMVFHGGGDGWIGFPPNHAFLSLACFQGILEASCEHMASACWV